MWKETYSFKWLNPTLKNTHGRTTIFMHCIIQFVCEKNSIESSGMYWTWIRTQQKGHIPVIYVTRCSIRTFNKTLKKTYKSYMVFKLSYTSGLGLIRAMWQDIYTAKYGFLAEHIVIDNPVKVYQIIHLIWIWFIYNICVLHANLAEGQGSLPSVDNQVTSSLQSRSSKANGCQREFFILEFSYTHLE